MPNPTTEEIVAALRECGDGDERTCEACPVECPGVPGCQEELKQVAADRLEELEAKQPRWISVEERLPEEGKLVLIFVTNPAGWECVTTDAYSNGEWLENCDTECHNVTHWMPLPEPPKED